MSWGDKPPNSTTFVIVVDGHRQKNPQQGYFKLTDAMGVADEIGTKHYPGGRYPLVHVRKLVNGKLGRAIAHWEGGVKHG